MSTFEIIILAGLLLTAGLVVWLIVTSRQGKQPDVSMQIDASLQGLKSELLQKQMEGLLGLRESIDSAQRTMNERLAEGTGALDRRMELFGEIENRLGQLARQTQNLEVIGGNIQSLSELLRPPQLRGALGEILLENLLRQILPAAMYSTQYRLSGGQRVDAVVKLADRLLPIDSKFPLESFRNILSREADGAGLKELNRTLKKYIDDIAAKYLRPDEDTTDFAVMYIPSEAVYYQFISQGDNEGMSYALSRNVIPSSPGHLYAFLASVAAVYTQANLSGGSRDLIAGLNQLADSAERLRRLHERIESSHRAIGNSLTRFNSELSSVTTTLDKLRTADSLPSSDSENNADNSQAD